MIDFPQGKADTRCVLAITVQCGQVTVSDSARALGTEEDPQPGYDYLTGTDRDMSK